MESRACEVLENLLLKPLRGSFPPQEDYKEQARYRRRLKVSLDARLSDPSINNSHMTTILSILQDRLRAYPGRGPLRMTIKGSGGEFVQLNMNNMSGRRLRVSYTPPGDNEQNTADIYFYTDEPINHSDGYQLTKDAVQWIDEVAPGGKFSIHRTWKVFRAGRSSLNIVTQGRPVGINGAAMKTVLQKITENVHNSAAGEYTTFWAELSNASGLKQAILQLDSEEYYVSSKFSASNRTINSASSSDLTEITDSPTLPS